MKRIAITGHRPNKLIGGYNLNSKENIELYNTIYAILTQEILNTHNDESIELIHGGALGADMIFAKAALALKTIYANTKEINIVSILPFKYQSKQYFKSEKSLYDIILKNSSEIIYEVGEYVKGCELKRNQKIVDRADKLLAVWNGDYKTGTGSTVRRMELKNQNHPNNSEKIIVLSEYTIK